MKRNDKPITITKDAESTDQPGLESVLTGEDSAANNDNVNTDSIPNTEEETPANDNVTADSKSDNGSDPGAQDKHPGHDDAITMHKNDPEPGVTAKVIGKSKPRVDETEITPEQAAAVEAFFNDHPLESEVYVSSDCNCFYAKDSNYAFDHKVKNNLSLHLCKRSA